MWIYPDHVFCASSICFYHVHKYDNFFLANISRFTICQYFKSDPAKKSWIQPCLTVMALEPKLTIHKPTGIGAERKKIKLVMAWAPVIKLKSRRECLYP